MAQAEDCKFDMRMVERQNEAVSTPMMWAKLQELSDEMEARRAGEATKESLKSLAAEMFEGREWSWSNA